MPHTAGDVDDLFLLYRQIADDTAMSIDARAGYLTAVVRVDKRISKRLDCQPNETLVALFRERLVAEDIPHVCVHPPAAAKLKDAAEEMERSPSPQQDNESSRPPPNPDAVRPQSRHKADTNITVK